MTEPVLRWTPNEAHLFAELAARALVASLDGAAPMRAGERWRVERVVSSDAIELVIIIDAERASIALRPEGAWPDAWVLERTLERTRGARSWILRAGGEPIELEQPRDPIRIALRTERRALVRELDGEEVIVPLADVAFHRYTRQSSIGPALSRSRPTSSGPSPPSSPARAPCSCCSA